MHQWWWIILSDQECNVCVSLDTNEPDTSVTTSAPVTHFGPTQEIVDGGAETWQWSSRKHLCFSIHRRRARCTVCGPKAQASDESPHQTKGAGSREAQLAPSVSRIDNSTNLS
jgi:hypothetical protein